jgi:Flp pilus assembly protein TadG
MGKRSFRNDAGSAFVELALVLPLLCLVLIGSVELGRIAYAAIEVSNAARAAVAYGSQNLVTASDSTDMASAASADAADLTSLGATLSTTTTTACVCDTGSSTPSVSCGSLAQLCCPPGETANCTTGYYTGTGVVYVEANTSATVKTIFNYPAIPPSFTLHGFAQMRVLQD